MDQAGHQAEKRLRNVVTCTVVERRRIRREEPSTAGSKSGARSNPGHRIDRIRSPLVGAYFLLQEVVVGFVVVGEREEAQEVEDQPCNKDGHCVSRLCAQSRARSPFRLTEGPLISRAVGSRKFAGAKVRNESLWRSPVECARSARCGPENDDC